VGEAGAAAAYQVDVAREIELLHFYFFHPAVLDFPADAHARDDGYAHAHLYEALDAFNGGHFDGHVELGVIAGEELDDAAAKGGFDDVGDEGFAAEVGDVDFALAGQGMLGRDDQGEFIFQDFGGLQLRVARDVGDGAEVEAIVEDFVGDVAGKHAMDADLHAGMFFAKYGEGGEESVDGAFVDAERKFAALEAFELGEAFFDFVAEVDEAFGVVFEEGAGVGHAHGAGAADEEGLAEAVFEFANRQADRGLGAIEAFGGAREATFFGNGEKDLKFAEIHDWGLESSIRQVYQMQNKDKFD
jgi:hypothetical protein